MVTWKDSVTWMTPQDSNSSLGALEQETGRVLASMSLSEVLAMFEGASFIPFYRSFGESCIINDVKGLVSVEIIL